MKYRVFIQDVGRNGFSGFADVEASSPEEAIKKTPGPKKRIAIAHSKKNLWPDSKTGLLKKHA